MATSLKKKFLNLIKFNSIMNQVDGPHKWVCVYPFFALRHGLCQQHWKNYGEDKVKKLDFGSRNGSGSGAESKQKTIPRGLRTGHH